MEASPSQSNGGSIATNPLKRPRPVLSCLECRRKKLKCDRLLPCNQCEKSRLACAYSGDREGTRRNSSVIESHDESIRPQKRARQGPPEAWNGQTSGPQHINVGIIEDLQARVTALERSMQGNGSNKAGNSDNHQEEAADSAPERHLPLSRARAHGKSLGLMANFDEAREFMLKLQRPNEDLEIQNLGTQLRDLQNMAKTSRKSATRPQAQSIESGMIELLPSRETCLQLLDIYFENFEHCLRILHRPSFLAEHERFWKSREDQNGGDVFAQNHNPTFVPRLLATLLVACTTNLTSVCKTASLAGVSERALAYELLDNWNRGLKSREKASLHALQVGTLRMLVHHERPPSAEEAWSNSGALLRLAMAGRLHLDPDQKENILESEQKRRLFATLLELDLASSVMCGMPTMLTPDEFTCRPPANINDNDIKEDTTEMPPSRDTETWTDTLCQFVLATSLRQRLEAYRLVTKAGPNIDYDEIIEHARQLECELQSLPAPLRFASMSEDATRISGRLYPRIHVDMAIRRTMVALYAPFAIFSIKQDLYKEARIGYVQSCLVITCYQDLFDPTFSEMTHGDPGAYWDLYYQDFKREALRATLGICLEIKWMRHMGFDTDPPGATANDLDPHRYYDPTIPTKLWKLPAWSIVSLTKAVEDTLEPLVRRAGRLGSDLKDLGCIAIVYHSVREDGDEQNTETVMKRGLSEVIAACQKNLHQQRQSVGQGPPSNGDSSASQYLTPEFNFNFDDIWGDSINLDDTTAMMLMNPEPSWPIQY